ncbi:MAG: hypothetical protein A2X64_00450 [Ignavibacteria bacterium GWF2_33_9]|nr:MAG: hypothetical protein A2X64_00450 [Ignavibacteria bacterium GWF2_33_9]
MLITTQFNSKAEERNENQNIVTFVDSLANLLCPEIQEELKKQPFEKFEKLQIDSTKYSKECLEGYHNFYNYFCSLDILEEKYLEYYHIIGLAGINAELPFLIDKVNLKAIYSKILGERFNYVKWHKIYKDNYKIIDKQHDSLSYLDTLYGIYIPKDIEETISICKKILMAEDIERIMSYTNDDDCFWNEIVLSGKTIRKEFLLFLRPRLTSFFEKELNTVNPFVISGLIIVHLRNSIKNEKFDYINFYKKIRDYDALNNRIPIKGKKVINMDDRE